VTAVGFDLDMTLVDTRPGIQAALLALADETARDIDVDAIVARLGPPIVEALSPFFAADELSDAVRRFRAHMARIGVQNVSPLPGALAAVEAARRAGHRVVVVTSKIEPLAIATLENAGLGYDAVAGDVWSTGKAAPLRDADAIAYVGDHPGDMAAAIAAEATAVGVTSGASSAEELREAGAATVLASLAEFPHWLDEFVR